jgi:hypothetical protein
MRYLFASLAIITVGCVAIPKIYPPDIVTVRPETWKRHVSESRSMSLEFGFLTDANFHLNVCEAR